MKFITPGPYASAGKANHHYLTGFLNYLSKHGPQQRIEVLPVDENLLDKSETDDVREFRVGAAHIEAKVDGVWVPISHFYVWDRVIVGKGEPDGNGHVVCSTQNKLVISQPV